MSKTMKISEIVIDVDIQNALRPLNEEEKTGLYELIKKEGINNPLLISGIYLIDGHHRLAIAKDLGLTKVPIVDIGFMTKSFMIERAVNEQRHRRNMTKEDWEDFIRETVKDIQDKKEIGELPERAGRPKKELAPSGTNFETPMFKENLGIHPLIKLEAGKKTSESIAEYTEEQTGIPTSHRQVERIKAEMEPDKPKRFIKKDIVKGCIIFIRKDNHSWIAHHKFYHSKQEAREHVKKQRDAGDHYYEDGIGYALIDINFFTEVDQIYWENAQKQ